MQKKTRNSTKLFFEDYFVYNMSGGGSDCLFGEGEDKHQAAVRTVCRGDGAAMKEHGVFDN
ncbi:MAG: hypothetical protein NC342_08055 [Pseudoflavonifractor sp.]|nr:hypothetical protein [Pseudoflavonifractor sp.]